MPFDFEVKSHIYYGLLSKTKEELTAGDEQSGLADLNQAMLVLQKLILNCANSEMKQRLKKEYVQLSRLKKSLALEHINPFWQKRSDSNVSNAEEEMSKRTDANGHQKTGKNGAASAKYFSLKSPDVKLADVAGLDSVKREISLNLILPMKNPDLYYRYKEKGGCQILLYGPPGCGKSFVAEAIAGELNCPYAVINVFDVLDKYVGEGPKRIKEIFSEANCYDDCLLFFDEIDALCASRDSDDSHHTHDILTAFLTCLSGFRPTKENGMKAVLAATNRPWALDPALLRGKRFDTQLYIGLPDEAARLFLVKKAFVKHPEIVEGSDITIEQMAESLNGYSGADISSILEKTKTFAMVRALEHPEVSYEKVSQADFTSVLHSYRNSVTPEMLEVYQHYQQGGS